jgi:hypothetical protein
MATTNAEWLHQLDSMRLAVAEYSAFFKHGQDISYGQAIPDFDFSYGDNLFHPWETEEDDHELIIEHGNRTAPDVYDRHWLHQRCAEIGNEDFAFSTEEIEGQLVALLTSKADGML